MDESPAWFDALSDRYRYVRELGRGGMACVYLVEDLRYQRKVALKVLRDELAHAVAHDRFLEEIRVAARLNHPNIVPLYDSGIIPATGGHPALPWFTMMYIAGESLRERLAGGPLPVPDAVDITRAVAAALDYAHGERVIHRDIKPGNILLAGEVPVVADFGIARALDRTAGGLDTLTSPGLAVGTAHYIAPEQAGGGRVDERADVYSLGCVVYEMLAGHPPFTGPTPQAIIARHNMDPPPPLGTVRPTVPPATVAAVEKALEKQPPDRWHSAGAFAHALRETTEHPAPPRPAPRGWRAWGTRRRAGVATLVLLAAASGAWYVVQLDVGPGRRGVQPDTTRYVVFPFSYADGGVPPLGEEEALRDALGRWEGLSVEEPFRVRERLRRGGRVTAPDGEEALRVARAMGAGRIYQGTVARVGDSLRVYAAVIDVPTRRELRSAQVLIDAGLRGQASALRGLADTLLLREVLATDGTGAYPGAGTSLGSASLPALQSFAAGRRAIDAWNLAEAEAAFQSALEFDSDFPQAALWLALVRAWSEQPPPRWEWAVRIAADGATRLDPRDSVILAALQARAAEDMVSACRHWAGLTRTLARDFVGWFGSGDCQRADKIVLRHAASPSGWRFRSSYHAALEAYRRAFRLHPSVHRAFRGNAYASLDGLFLTSPRAYNDGRTAPGSPRLEFFGIPVWEADTLLVVPVSVEEVAASPAYVRELHRRRQEALAHLRGDFLEIARGWASAFPRSPEALEALAYGMALVGDPTSADTLARARRLARGTPIDLELAGEEVWFRLRLGGTGDLAAVRRSAQLAESLLALPGLDSAAPDLAAGLAALTGKAARLHRLASTGAYDLEWDPPDPLRQIGPSLWAFAALPWSIDSTVAYARRVRDAIARVPSEAERQRLTTEWLGRAVPMAFPDQVLAEVLPLVEGMWYLYRAIASHARGDIAGVRAALAEWPRALGDLENLDISTDLLPAEAMLRWKAGDSAVAVGMLQASLATLEVMGSNKVSDPLLAAGAGRALALWAAMDRARPPGRTGFAEEAAQILWAKADRPVGQVISAYHAALR
ncbi:MAG TPA: serine/threonine-protein kinase [Gemmatimonadales bacterium]|nr:serine/threonine-protein kinase [Gemmatimonadales bacterium]